MRKNWAYICSPSGSVCGTALVAHGNLGGIYGTYFSVKILLLTVFKKPTDQEQCNLEPINVKAHKRNLSVNLIDKNELI